METRNTVFSTLTVARDCSPRDAWLVLSQTTNRYVQRIRRTVDYCDYVKVYELHKDSYPHVHVLFIFRNLKYPYNNSRWLPDNVFSKLKLAWSLGLSDHQSPTSNKSNSTLNYILKYLAKSTSASHLWSMLLTPTVAQPPSTNDLGYPQKRDAYSSYHSILVPKETTLTATHLKVKRIKLLTWSRGFVQAYLSTLPHSEPCPKRPNLHTPQ